MNHPRFRLPGAPDPGDELIRRSDKLRLSLYRVDGGLHATFEVSGELGDNADGEWGPTRPGDMAFLKDLIEQFGRSNGGPCHGA